MRGDQKPTLPCAPLPTSFQDKSVWSVKNNSTSCARRDCMGRELNSASASAKRPSLGMQRAVFDLLCRPWRGMAEERLPPKATREDSMDVFFIFTFGRGNTELTTGRHNWRSTARNQKWR